MRGRVVSMTEYGAFVQLEEGIEGMVHVSEMSWTRRVRYPNEMLSVGDEVDVMVLSVDKDEEKIALGIKQTQPNPWKQLSERYPVGSTIKGTVRNMTITARLFRLKTALMPCFMSATCPGPRKSPIPTTCCKRTRKSKSRC